MVPFLLRGDASASRVFEAYDAIPAVLDRPGAKEMTPNEVEGRVVFENVSFAFRRPDGELDPPAIKNINLTIEPGQRIGILGATGAGKSALVNLIPRFYDVTEGRITIDGIDVRDIPQANLRQIVGIALQEAVLFQGDMTFNLKFGNPEAEDEVMYGAAQAADAYGFVSNLPQTVGSAGGPSWLQLLGRTAPAPCHHPHAGDQTAGADSGRQHQCAGCGHRKPGAGRRSPASRTM